MTSLNPRLRLALLNRKKSRNLLDKGFTLVELMIVIVIVGILSAVALPNFLSQTDRAKATEARSLMKAYLTNYHIASLEGDTSTVVNKLSDSDPGACPENTANWQFRCTGITGGSTAQIEAIPSGGTWGTDQFSGTVSSTTGAITIEEG